MTTLDELYDASYETLHGCDQCGNLCCDTFAKTEGVIHACTNIDGLWLCDECWPIETVVSS